MWPQYLTPNVGTGQGNGTVALAELLEPETVMQVTLTNGGNLSVALPNDAEFRRAAPVGLNFDPTAAHIFSA